MIDANASESERSRVLNVRQLAGRNSLPELLDMLTDPSWVVRRSVVEALAQSGDAAVAALCDLLRTKRDNEARIAAAVDALVASRGAVEPLVQSMAGDKDPAVVTDAVQILGRRRSVSSVTLLVKLTAHENDVVAVGALEALGRIGGKAAVDALIATIGQNSFFRTFPAIDILGRSGDRRVIEPLAKLLSNPVFLPEAARSLGRTGERAALKPLLGLLNSGADSIVRIAALAIWDLYERVEEKTGQPLDTESFLVPSVSSDVVRRLSRAMASGDVAESVAICRLFGVIGSQEAASILLTKLDGPEALASCAAQTLKKIGADSDSHLLNAIREGDSARRKILLPLVSRNSSATEIAACLADRDAEVRALTCETLARIGGVSVVPEIFKLLADGNLMVVHSATAALQALGSREARALAIEGAGSGDPNVRRAAIRILSYFGDESGLSAILAALADDDAKVREVAILGLPYLEHPQAFAALFAAAKSADDRTRGLAMRAIGQLPKADEKAISFLLRGLKDADAWVRYYACQALGKLGYAPAAGDLSRLLSDPAGQVRVSAVEALSHLDSREAHDALRGAAASDEADVKRAAIVGLGIGRRLEDLPVVFDAIGSEDTATRLIALSAIVNFVSPRVVGALSEAARDKNEQIRSAAIGFLSSRPEREATGAMLALLKEGEDAEKLKLALQIPNAGRIGGLVAALEDADEEMAPAIVSILARLPRPETRNALLSAMKSKNISARRAVAAVLSASRDPEKIAALRDAAENDPDEGVRQICSLLLAE